MEKTSKKTSPPPMEKDSHSGKGKAPYEEGSEPKGETKGNKVLPIDLLVFRAAIRTETLMPLDRMLSESLQIDKMDPLEVALFYQEAFKLVSYMVERFSMYRMKEILVKFKEGKQAEQAIEEVLGISTEQLEKEWLLSLK